MIHHQLVQHIQNERRVQNFLYPFYEGYCIADFGPTLLHSFGLSQDRKLLDPLITGHKAWNKSKKVLLLVDGLGYSHFVKYYKRYPFLERLAKKGDIYPLTSVFPSTTAAALTTIHTGLTPQEHGLPEWNVYFEEFDSIIQTLPFKTWEMEGADGLLKKGGSPDSLYEGITLYQQLEEASIPSYVFIFYKYLNSAYSQAVHTGSHLVPFTSAEDLIEKFLQVSKTEKRPAYFMLYWGEIDGVAHQFGPNSREHVAAIASFFGLLEEKLLPRLSPDLADQMLFTMLADHGHVNIKHEDIINLNKYSQIENTFLKSKTGKKILPTGSPHDIFLFVEPKKIRETVEFLQEELVAKAEIITSEEALQRGLFGVGHPNEKFLRRIGNVLILPYEDYHIWYEFFPNTRYTQLGIHGGLSEEEMLVPLAVASMKDLLPPA